MREKQIEQRLVKAVKAQNGMCPKLVSPGTDGMPDRMVLLPDGKLSFVEVKAPGESHAPCRYGGMSSYASWGSGSRCWMTRNKSPAYWKKHGGDHSAQRD